MAPYGKVSTEHITALPTELQGLTTPAGIEPASRRFSSEVTLVYATQDIGVWESDVAASGHVHAVSN